MALFVIPGYGVPKDISKDDNYSFYLKMAFNRLYDIAQSVPGSHSIFLTGGKTDCFSPYTRSEAGEMKYYLEQFLYRKKELSSFLKRIKMYTEEKSLSTLDNIIATRDFAEKKSYTGDIYFFCEKTRERTVKKLARTICGARTHVAAIDFDVSANRYNDPKKIEEIRSKMLAFHLWGFESQENLKRHRAVHRKRIEFLRRHAGSKHVEAVRAWYDIEMEKVILERS